MAKQIILTQNNFGVPIELQFVSNTNSPIDLTGKTVEVAISYNGTIIDVLQATINSYTNGTAYIIVNTRHTSNVGLYTTFWSVRDEYGYITAQSDLYYYVKEEYNGAETPGIEQDKGTIEEKFNEINSSIGLLNEENSVISTRVSGIEIINSQLTNNIETINSQLDTITIIMPKSNDFEELQNFINDLPDNVNLKFPKFTYELDNVLVLNSKNNIIVNSNEATFISKKHGYGCIELYNCKNIEWQGGTLIGKGNYPVNTFNDGVLSNEKEDYKGVWGFRRNGDSKSTPSYNGGYLGNCGIGMLIHQGCENITVRNIKATLFNFSGICIGFRGNGDYGWGNKEDVVISKNIRIMNCHCYDNFSSGILVCQVDGFEISSCKVENNGHPSATNNDLSVDPGYGITCTGTWYHAKNGFIKNNIATNNKRKGIDAHAGENIEISDNIIDNSFMQGIAVVTNNAENERLLDFKIMSNTILNCANGGTGDININRGIIAQGDNTIKITNNIIKNSATRDGSYAIEVTGGTKIVDGNMIENSGSKASIRNYSNVSIITNNNIKSSYTTSIMTGDSIFTKIENNYLYSTYKNNPTFIYMNGSESGMISSNSSNKKSFIGFGTNTSNIEIFNNNNISVEDNINGKSAILRPFIYTFKVFVGSDSALTFNDYGRNFVKGIETNAYGMKVNFYKKIKNVTISITSADSQFANKIKNVYLREVHDNAIIIGLDNEVTGYGKPIETFKPTALIVTLTTY